MTKQEESQTDSIHTVTNAACVFALQAPHLSLWEAQRHWQLCLPAHGDVAVALELPLQLQPLLVGVHHPVLVLSASFPCWLTQKSPDLAREIL